MGSLNLDTNWSLVAKYNCQVLLPLISNTATCFMELEIFDLGHQKITLANISAQQFSGKLYFVPRMVFAIFPMAGTLKGRLGDGW